MFENPFEKLRDVCGVAGGRFQDAVLTFKALAEHAFRQVPEDMRKGSMQWLADELLSALRLQEPPWDGLADELVKVANQPGTDP